MKYFASLTALLVLVACGGAPNSEPPPGDSDPIVTSQLKDVCAGETFVACGGDMVGAWSKTEICSATNKDSSTLEGEDPACATSTVDITLNVNTFDLDLKTTGDYTFSSNATGDLAISLTDPCVKALSGIPDFIYDFATACGALPSVAAQSANFPPGITDLQCGIVGSNCECDSPIDYTEDQTGTYTTDDVANTLTLNYQKDGAAKSDTYPYCAETPTMILDLTRDPAKWMYAVLGK